MYYISLSDYYSADNMLRDAVREWLDNREAALEKYSDIIYWCISRVTYFFNENLSM